MPCLPRYLKLSRIHLRIDAKFEACTWLRDYSSAITTFNPVIPLFSQPFLLLHVKYKDERIIERTRV